MKNRKIRPEVLLCGVVIASLIVGALIGVTVTWAVMTATEADAAPVDIEEERFHEKSNAQESVTSHEECFESITEGEGQYIGVYRVGLCEVTAYCACMECCGRWSSEHPDRIGTNYVQKTASGTIPEEGRTVAVDPEIIPLGAIVWIRGVSYIAEDTGGSVKGRAVDIYFDSHEEAENFGRQEVEIYCAY